MEQIQQILQEAQSRVKEGGTYTAKAAGTILESTNITGSGMGSLGTQSLGYLNRPATDSAGLFDLFPKVFVNSNSLVLASEVTDDGSVTAVTEGGLKPQIDSDYNSLAPTIGKYAATITISDEMLDDIGFMSEAISSQLIRRVKDKIADTFLKALISNAGVTNTSITAGTTGTKLMDMFPAIYSDVLTKFGQNIDLFLLNSPDFAKAWVQSNNSDTFLEKYQKSLLPSSAVSAGSVLGVATLAQRIYVLQDLTFEFGKINDDFKYNRTSVRCEARVGWALGANNTSGIYSATIASTLTAML